MSPLRISPLAGLLSAALLLTGCFNEADKTPENSGDARVRLAMLQPPRSGLTPLSDDALNCRAGVRQKRWSFSINSVKPNQRWQQNGSKPVKTAGASSCALTSNSTTAPRWMRPPW